MVTVAVLGAACSDAAAPTAGVATAKAEAARGARTPGAVSALGRLEPRGEIVDIAAPGERLAELFVEEGDWVQAGDSLVRLESHAERVAERDRIASRLEEARERLAAEIDLGEAEIAAASLAIREIEELHPLEVDELSAQVASLEAALENDRRELRRLRSLLDQGGISPAEYDRHETVTRQRTESLRSAEARLRRLQEGRSIRLEQERARLRRATAALALARTAAQVESLERELVLADTRADNALLRAPTDGRVLRIHRRAGEAAGSGPILSLADTGDMIAVGEVYETDVQWVETGQAAWARSPALAEPLTGTVVFVGSVVDRNEILDIDPVADTDRRVVEVKIALDESERAAALVNLQVDIEIETSDSGS